MTAENLLSSEDSTTAISINDCINWEDDDDGEVDGSVDISKIDWINSSFAIWEPTLYDLDSCYSADNNGYLQVPYYAEWSYQDSDGVNKFNGYGSRLWLCFEEAFASEIKDMACQLAKAELMTYEKFYKAHITDNADVVCASVVNKDMDYKYSEPWLVGYYDYSTSTTNPGWLQTSDYKYLHRGQRKEQKQAYIYNRSHMWYSKYQTTQFENTTINFCVGKTGGTETSETNATLTASICLYLGAQFGDNTTIITNGKINPNTETTLQGVGGVGYSDTVRFYMGSDLTDIGDISVFRPYEIQLGNGKKLKNLIIGNEDITNSALQSLDTSSCSLLQIINVAGCTSVTDLDLEDNGLIQEVYAQNSGIKTIELPEGSNLTVIHYPDVTQYIVVVNHTKMETFDCDGYDNLTRLCVENTPNIPTDEILLNYLSQLTEGIRLVGVEWDFTGIEEGTDYYGKPELLQLLVSDDAYGKYLASDRATLNTKAYPTITGTVTIDYINHTLYEELQSLYPNLVIQTSDGDTPTFTYTVTFLDGDGNEISVQEVQQNGAATDPISLGITPTKSSTAQYYYTLVSSSPWNTSGWTAVTKDLTVNAQFTATLQVYGVAFYESSSFSTAFDTQTSITYGETISYGGEELSSDTEVFVGWTSKSGTDYEFNSITLDDDCCTIDSDGNPETVIFYANFQEVAMPTLSASITDLTSLTYGELKAVANMIRDGSDDTWTVSDTYFEESGYYLITNVNTSRYIRVALNSELAVSLSDGTAEDFYICDLNHDVDEDGNLIGITFGMCDLYTGTTIDSNGCGYRRNMNPSYKQCYDFRIGDGNGTVSTGSDSYTGTDGYTHYVNDNGDYTSTTDTTNSVVYTPSSAEYTAKYVELEFSGRTFLRSIVVTSGSTDTTWYFDYNGYYCGTDSTSVSSLSWYLSDYTSDTYKIGKAFYEINGAVADAATISGASYTPSSFGDMVLDVTDGQITHYYYVSADGYQYAEYNEITDGVIFKIPVSSGETITINPWTYSRNVGGYERTAYREWVNDTFIEMLPLGWRSIITPAAKTTSIGNRSTTVATTVDSVWAFSGKEVGTVTSTDTSYGDEGTLYPVFSNADSRIKKYEQGEGVAYYWWLHSPAIYTTLGGINFHYINSSGSATGGNGNANGTYGVHPRLMRLIC